MFAAPDPVLIVDGDAVAHNLAVVRERADDVPIYAVLKDNAYGHGMLVVGRVLADLGVDRFAVGSVEEACALQAAGIAGDILNLRLFMPGEAPRIVARRIRQAVFTNAHVHVLGKAAGEAGCTARVHVKVDTGLCRFGIPVAQAASFIRGVRRHPNLSLEGVFSTLGEDPDRDRDQIALFADLRREVGEGETWHLTSSAGLLRHTDARFDAVRTGCLICGFPPGGETDLGLRPTVRLEAPVLDVREFEEGDRVGFHGRWAITRKTRALVIGAGVRHGLLAAQARGGEILSGGRRHPIRLIGGEHLLAEFRGGHLPAPGDAAVLIGTDGDETIGLDEWAWRMGASAYTALIALRSRVRRILLGASDTPPTYG
jgi:alanine racemase